MENIIAREILRQLGGNWFAVMTGTTNFVDLGNGLGMRLRRNKTQSNYLRITLSPMDTYTMEFIRVGKSIKHIDTFENVYCDQLQAIFTSTTGLNTKL